MKIIILDGYSVNPGDLSWKELEAMGELVVHDRTAPSQIEVRARDADALLTNKVPVSAETSAVVIVTPALGPSLGTAPSGTWMWISSVL